VIFTVLKLATGWLWGLLKSVPWQVWVTLAAALAVLYYGHTKDRAGYERAQAEYVAIERDRQAEAAKLRAATEKRFRDQENQHAHAMANLDRQYAAELAASEDRARRDRDAARRGDIVLRIPGPACDGPAGAQAAPSQGSAGRGDGPATVELPREVTADLLDLVNDADQVADQLRACQAVVRADREDKP
jgi:prophage endopeptidase